MQKNIESDRCFQAMADAGDDYLKEAARYEIRLTKFYSADHEQGMLPVTDIPQTSVFYGAALYAKGLSEYACAWKFYDIVGQEVWHYLEVSCGTFKSAATAAQTEILHNWATLRNGLSRHTLGSWSVTSIEIFQNFRELFSGNIKGELAAYYLPLAMDTLT
ncbi:MAG: hypothetical protein PHQ23_16690, partial [Candidatus Wallbacteria bacterium]|nr:hypothetical protein [Candidatus Wallbacteria bacterium]